MTQPNATERTNKHKSYGRTVCYLLAVIVILCLLFLLSGNNGGTTELLRPSPTFASKEDTKNNHTHHNACPARGPVIINVGPGTTGTTSFFASTCHLGLPSVHFVKACQGNSSHSKEFSEALDVHLKLKNLWRRAKWCMHDHCSQEDNPGKDAEALLAQMRELMKSLLEKDQISFFHDIPYPPFSNMFEQVHREVYQSDPLIMMSERDAPEWALKRIQNHGALVCQEDYGFNFQRCIEHAIAKRKALKDSTPIGFTEIFWMFPKPKKRIFASDQVMVFPDKSTLNVSDVIRGYERGMQEVMKEYRNRTFFHLNLFNQANRLATPDIASRIRGRLPDCLVMRTTDPIHFFTSNGTRSSNKWG